MSPRGQAWSSTEHNIGLGYVIRQPQKTYFESKSWQAIYMYSCRAIQIFVRLSLSRLTKKGVLFFVYLKSVVKKSKTFNKINATENFRKTDFNTS